MFGKKLLLTVVLSATYGAVATVADFVINIIVLKTPGAFSPAETAGLAVVIGAPITYYLLSQRFDLKRALEERNRTSEDLRRKSAELVISEERYRLLADRSPDVIIRYDTSGQVEYLSPAARKYGWDPDNLQGVNLAASLDPSEHERNARFLAELAAGRPLPQDADNTWQARTPSGQAVYFEGRSTAIKDDRGNVVGAVAALRDVSERQAAAEALERSEQKLRGLFELAPVGIALTDMQGRYIEFNEAFRAICGYTQDELKALDYWTLTPPEYEADEAIQLEALANTGRYGPYEKAYVRKDGARVPLRLNGLLIRGRGGEEFIWSIVEDITEERQAKAILIDARNAAEAANRSKSEFLANMSHEIRTPLNGVVAVSSMLARAELGPKEREMVEIVRASANSLERLLTDILDLSRIESGQVTIERAPFHLGELVRSVAAPSTLRALEKGVALDVNIAPDLPGQVFGDSNRLRQILSNLLSNAVKFTEQWRVVLRVARTAAGTVRFEVRDTGIGFDVADKERVLSRFQQADGSITRRFGGSGLGLTISRDLAELMGGVLDCDSALGAGSTFWLDLPLELAVGLEPAEAASTADPDRTCALRILLADDHPTNRKVVELMLAGTDADLTMVENGEQALAAYANDRFDLVLMDMQMPVMDGLTAVRRIRALEAERGKARVPIIMLTANAMPEHVEASHAAGADHHLGKPITPEGLFGSIDEVLWGQPLATRAAV